MPTRFNGPDVGEGGRERQPPRWPRLILGAFAALFASACASAPVVVPADADTFSGLASFVPAGPAPSANAAARPLRILLIHGIGTTTKDNFDGFIASLAGRLGLTQIPSRCAESPANPCPAPSSSAGLLAPVSRPIDIPGVPDADRAILYTYRFAAPSGLVSGAPAMTISFLLWSPLTSTIKCASLDEAACPNSNDAGAPPRQWFANVAKDFIDDKLADVVLYLGKYGKRVLRPTVESALCYLVDGRPTNGGRNCSTDDESVSADEPPTVIITHSLGGYMLMDSIHDELRRDARRTACNANTAAAKVVANAQLIYMMANQLALLDLAGPRTALYPAVGDDPPRHGGAAAATALKDFVADLSCIRPQGRLRRRAGEPPGPAPRTDQTRQIVAFSDPNDILSWLVKTNSLDLPPSSPGAVSLSNVYLSNNEFEIPLVISDPGGAHGGYFDNRTVIDLVACGMNKGAIGLCVRPAAR